MSEFIIPVLCTIPMFFPVYLCSIFMLFMGYMISIILLTPLWSIMELAGIIPPFHGDGNILIIPWKAFLVIALVITFFLLVKTAKEKIEEAKTHEEQEIS